jgi:hypothetical protein
MNFFSKFQFFRNKPSKTTGKFFLSPNSFQQTRKNLKVGQGQAMIMAVIFMTVAAILVPIGMKLVSDSSKKASQQEFSVADAENIAKAGVESSLAWFVRQSTQPVAYYAFGGLTPNPTYTTSWIDQPFNPTPVPGATDVAGAQVTVVGADTINSNIGLVNQYQISGNIWGRYEVVRQPNEAIGTVTATPQPNAVHDVSGYRVPNGAVANGSGLVWSVYSTGYIYKNLNSAIPYNQYPNQVLARANVVGELRKLAYNAPAPAAIVTYNMGNIIFGSTNGRLSSQVTTGGALIGYACAAVSNITGKPVTTVTGEINGNIKTSAVSLSSPVSTTLNPVNIFGMTESDIQGIANFTGNSSQGTTLVINSSQGYQLYYYKGNLTYDPCTTGVYGSLEGAGILYVNGNLILKDSCGGNGNNFNGVVYCIGNVYIGSNSSVYGTIIATGSVSITSSSSTGIGYADYDQSAVNQVTSQVAIYYEDKATTHSIFSPSIH